MIRTALISLLAFTLMGCLVVTNSEVVEVVETAGGLHTVIFRFAPTGEFSQVYLSGEMFGWNPRGQEMTDPDGDGVYETTVQLPSGVHLYKFVIDGSDWQPDPDNPHRTTDGYENSILYLGVEPVDNVQASAPPPASPRVWLPVAEQTTPTSQEHPTVLFSLSDAGYSEVFVSGDFNGWTGQLDQLVLNPATGQWGIPLAIGVDQCVSYRFVVTQDEEVLSIRDPSHSQITFDGHPVDSVLLMPGNADSGVVQVFEESFAASRGDVPPRTVWVWVPPGAVIPPPEGEEETRYPVLYVNDGQNAFDDPVNPFGHGGWHVNTTAEELINSGEIDPFIMVAMANTEERFAEYRIETDITSAEEHAYLRFVIDDVMPAVNAHYPTATGPENTAIMGSSMGGLISFLGAYHNPDVFGSAVCMSSSWFLGDDLGRTCADLVTAEGKVPVRVYLDSGNGGETQDGAPRTRAMRDAMVASGWTLGDDLVWHEEEGAMHTERAWRDRAWRPLTFLYGRD